MLDVIGAGATAQATQDWHRSWLLSPERKVVQDEVDRIQTDGQSGSSAEGEHNREFATTWFYQVQLNLARLATAYLRDPTYIMAKVSLSILGGIILGFTFFKASDSQQGTQNKLFVSAARACTSKKTV